MSRALAPHCWNATSFADPEYVMDFKSPNAFCALAITVFASCAMALAHRNARQITTSAIFLNTASPYQFDARYHFDARYQPDVRWNTAVHSILYPLDLV